MKPTWIPALAVFFLSSAQAALPVAWSACDNCAQPESVYYDGTSDRIFVSNVSGAPDKKDGQGWISWMEVSGKVKSAKWIKGLNAPKGMRSYQDRLWVSDIDTLVEISIKKAKVVRRVKIPGSKFLNDVAVIEPKSAAEKPRVLVSDTFAGKIWEVTNGKFSTFAEGAQLEAPNGLLVEGDDLIIAAWGIPAADWSTKVPGRLLRMNLATKAIAPITPAPLGNLDGLEKDGKGGYWVSDWMAGKVYRVSADGKSQLEVEGLKGSADLGVVEKSKQLIVPCMGESMIRAYALP